MILRRFIAAVALLCALVAPAYAQKSKAALNTEVGVLFPDNNIFAILPLNARTLTLDMINSIMPTAPVVTGNYACFQNTTGTLQDCGSSPTTCVIFTSTTNGCVPSSTGVTAIAELQASGAWAVPTAYTAQSRAAASALNLAGVNVVETLGYTTAGDGGGAIFKNVATSPFIDSQVTNGSLTVNGTSGCTNATYAGVNPTGGTGHGLQITYVVSGNIVTTATIVGNGGNGYTIGDVVSATITGCAATVTYTISAVSTPTGSFTDSAGHHFQIVVGQGNVINIRQFGAAMNWNSTAGDAGSTNDTTAIQNALNFAANTVQPTVDGGGVAGQTVLVPFGNTLSDALTVPFGVKLTGQNPWSSQIKFTDAMGAAIIPITVCDSTTHLACFGSEVANLTLKGGSGTASSNVPMVFSNNMQQTVMLWRVVFYPGQRGCVQYDTGYGGAAQVGFVEVECTMSNQGYTGFNFSNVGTTLFYLHNVNAEFGGSGVSGDGFAALGGFFDIDNFHTEGVSTGIFWNNTSGVTAGALRVHNASGGSHCTNLVLKQSASTANDVIVGMAVPNGCTNTVNNGGSNTTTPVIADTLY